mgnify:FL=1
MGMYKPWRSPPPAAKDEFDCVWCEGETETLNLRVYITEPDEDESGPIPSEAQLFGIWTGDMFLGPDFIDRDFVEKLEIHAYKVFTGEIKMAEAEYRIAKFEECAA